MDENRLTLKEIFDGMYHWAWRDQDPLLRFLRAVFVINYPLLAICLYVSNPDFIFGALLGPLLAMPAQGTATVCLNYLYLTKSRDYKSIDDLIEKSRYRSDKLEAQSSDISQRILAATLSSVPLYLIFAIFYIFSN